MKAIILAAGLGTRLRPLTDNIPKPLVPVANTPNIIHIIKHLKNADITDITINLHYKPKPLQKLLNNGSDLGVKIKYSIEKNILGTGGGIKKMLKNSNHERTVVINGDALFMPDIKTLIQKHHKSKAVASMIVHTDKNAEKLGAVGVDGNGIVRRLVYAGDKTIDTVYMFTGMHILEPGIIDLLPENGCIVRNTYIPMVKQQSEDLFAIPDNSYFCDLGTPGDFLNANIQIAKGELKLPIDVNPHNTVITGKNVTAGQNCSLHNSVIGSNVTIEDNVSISDCVVINNATVTSDIKNSIILKNNSIMEVTK